MSSSVHRGIGMTSQRTRERLIQRLRDEGIKNQTVLDVMRNTPRHIFVDEALASRAYEDTALPIGQGQTISQPYIVARMSEMLFQGGPIKRVLEIGTGCGYQTAVLAQLADRVYTVERIRALQQKARERLRRLGLRNIQFRHADGLLGWPERGPFDGILASASPRQIPTELLGQLAEGGRLVIPVGDADQMLHLVVKDGAEYRTEVVEPVKFVPMIAGVQ